MSVRRLPFIPDTITVHLGRPDEYAENVTLPFPEYIKNVASSEIYPTWPESAIIANIYAQISFALNRVYTEFYRSRGYDFDITNTTQYDQKFIKDREIFENISQIVDEIFNNYVVKQGSIEPYFTAYCNGTTSTCEGLSQWGTVALANQGMAPYEILQHYYGDDINIVFNAPISNNIESYPGIALRLGSTSNEVQLLQAQLNRISDNYPAIPKIQEVNGTFGVDTENAVKAFQRIFNLTPDGIVGKATWYKIKYIYNGVKNLSELASEGLTLDEISVPFPILLQEGERGDPVRAIQYYLNVIAYFYPEIPSITIDGIYGPETKNAVMKLQELYGITQDGIIGRDTWSAILNAYQSILSALPAGYQENKAIIYPGYFLVEGMADDNVRALQTYLLKISQWDSSIPTVNVTGQFDQQTKDAVIAFQRLRQLDARGIVGPITWNEIAQTYDNI